MSEYIWKCIHEVSESIEMQKDMLQIRERSLNIQLQPTKTVQYANLF